MSQFGNYSLQSPIRDHSKTGECESLYLSQNSETGGSRASIMPSHRCVRPLSSFRIAVAQLSRGGQKRIDSRVWASEMQEGIEDEESGGSSSCVFSIETTSMDCSESNSSAPLDVRAKACVLPVLEDACSFNQRFFSDHNEDEFD